jgi:hypothetical protein
MAANDPLARVKEQFGDKAKLVASLEKLTTDDLWVSRTNKDKGLAHVSNAKLLRLHALFSEVKEKFGTRDKLIEAILELEKRTKDSGWRQKLASWPVPRLFDAYKSAAKRARAGDAAAKAAAAPRPRGATAPKTQAKPAAPAAKAGKKGGGASSGKKASKPASKKSSAKKSARR